MILQFSSQKASLPCQCLEAAVSLRCSSRKKHTRYRSNSRDGINSSLFALLLLSIFCPFLLVLRRHSSDRSGRHQMESASMLAFCRMCETGGVPIRYVSVYLVTNTKKILYSPRRIIWKEEIKESETMLCQNTGGAQPQTTASSPSPIA